MSATGSIGQHRNSIDGESFFDNPGLDALYYKPELTDEEMVRVSTHTLRFVRMRENSWLQYESGVLDRVTWESYQRSIPQVLGPPRVRTWWKNFVADRGILNPGFIAMVDELLANTPEREYSLHISAFE